MNIISPAEYKVFLRHDFVSFLERSFYELNPSTKLLMAPYIELMASRLEDCRHGRVKRLIINIPPRNLKSHCASIAFPAWLLGHDPSLQIICASYGQDLADKLALDTKKVMASSWYQEIFPTRLAADKTSVSDFMTTARGGRMATSVGGVLTGRGADFIIIDDPMKPEDALSTTRRDGANNWYDSTAGSRLNDKNDGCIIVIMQRLHQDDLVGHLVAQGGWTVVSFPAIAELRIHGRHGSPNIHSPGRRAAPRRAREPGEPDGDSRANRDLQLLQSVPAKSYSFGRSGHQGVLDSVLRRTAAGE